VGAEHPVGREIGAGIAARGDARVDRHEQHEREQPEQQGEGERRRPIPFDEALP
jgi:hypothetical protein